MKSHHRSYLRKIAGTHTKKNFEKKIILVKFPNVLFHIHVFKDEQYLGTLVLFFNPVVVCTFSVRSKKSINS